MKDIVIIGAGGFAKEVQWLINDINKVEKEWNIIGFLDKDINNKGKIINGNYILGDFEDLIIDRTIYYTCAIADTKLREKLCEKADKLGLKSTTLIHPSVITSNNVKIGNGCIICAGSIITVDIIIGVHSIINLDTTIGHDVSIGSYVTVFPSANISGEVNVGNYTIIGTGAFVIQGINIGNNTILGANAVVLNNIQDNVVVVGNPSKIIKNI